MANLEINFKVKASRASQTSQGALFKRAQNVFYKTIKPPLEQVSLAFVSKAEMRQINFAYRHKNKATDVLSFEDLNEIIICPAIARQQALKTKKTLLYELVFLFIHGLLHLAGYSDDTVIKAKKMELIGNKIISKIIIDKNKIK